MHSVDTKSEIIKILHFKQFYKHYVFNEDGDGGRKKVLKNYIETNDFGSKKAWRIRKSYI
ncbi:hypothetical protein FUT79_07260 [Treponema phagedenis]|uniref:Uncharacterized protein n=1 Tax=Treponema phagedenis TaxID=162 RepID=A0A0B7GX71_TREPH|nr:hypothetical protein FUT79_07260 [Treponema phagedenis]QEJ98089.1 hypothetical protein FUT82_08820 [Treponema phagedenis]QEK03594.1 hypothetical protein FUT83_07110 [Treponema phagedenis]QEK05949.1 hypothetical protein FUT80_04005 [Treponema phagedenis]QEK09214.1 hypothetical protein FUT81_07030 [Treponema phagedenis]